MGTKVSSSHCEKSVCHKFCGNARFTNFDHTKRYAEELINFVHPLGWPFSTGNVTRDDKKRFGTSRVDSNKNTIAETS